MDQIVTVVVGTAGHIDHGKSSLVRRLTGIDPDRLKEERAREMTIDLGFAPFELPDGRRVGLIDVPGHERFVKNMVAGATGIDLVVLVVAADDGVMPQTREHLEILTLLGLEAGMIALTKIDLPGVDDELVEILELEIEELVEGTFLEGAPILPLDSLSGRGFEAFQEALVKGVEARAATRGDRSQGAYRQPIQRVFTAKGFGTVVTGIPLQGTLQQGDKVEVITAGGTLPGRVRGLQAYGRGVDRVRAGHSAAVNVADVDFKDVARGDTLAAPRVFRAHDMFEVRLEHLPSQARPIKQRQVVRVHLGTAEVLGEVVLLDRETLEPGESSLCQLRLRSKVVGASGDRFVIRRHSPMETLGGGTILGLSRWRLKPFKGFNLERLSNQESALGNLDQAILLALDERGQPARSDRLVETLQHPRQEVESALTALAERGEVLNVSGGKGQPVYLTRAGFKAFCDQVTDSLEAYHESRPLRQGLPRLELRSRLKTSEGVLSLALTTLVEAGEVAERPPGFGRAGFEVQLGEATEALAARLCARYETDGLNPTARGQVLEQEREDVKGDDALDVLLTLCDRGELVALNEEILLHASSYLRAQEAAGALGAQGPFGPSAFKDAIGSSRRVAIPLLERFDATGFTRRQGDTRVLVQD
ncbi:MAG: selenocysteine-specific translation elongation factor [Planctomycetes bacterium]|nr:selenocysteine-specific translation elongation factor [Planctomycetota bacterium]